MNYYVSFDFELMLAELAICNFMLKGTIHYF